MITKTLRRPLDHHALDHHALAHDSLDGPVDQTASRRRSARGTRFVARFGPTALVTGATEGIGRACAEELARRGLDLVIVGRRGDHLASLRDELEAEHGIRVTRVRADLGTDEGVRAVLHAIDGADVGLLVAAAGFGTAGPCVDTAIETQLEMVRVNCGATLELAWHLSRHLVARRRGGLVLFGSLVGFQGTPNAAAYAATKAFVQSLAEALRVELAPHGVEVLSVAPGPVRSGFAARADMRMGATVAPDTVARGALDALGTFGTVRPGALSKLLELALCTLPRFLRVRVIGIVMRGMTSHRALGKGGV